MSNHFLSRRDYLITTHRSSPNYLCYFTFSFLGRNEWLENFSYLGPIKITIFTKFYTFFLCLLIPYPGLGQSLKDIDAKLQYATLVLQISGETASSTVNAGSLSDLANLANASLYGFEDYHGVDIGVVRAVRLWYAPIAGEVAVEIRLKESDSKLGFAISRTEEVIFFSSLC